MIIFANDGVREDEFYKTMAEIGQKIWGTPDEKIFKEFLMPIGYEPKPPQAQVPQKSTDTQTPRKPRSHLQMP